MRKFVLLSILLSMLCLTACGEEEIVEPETTPTPPPPKHIQSEFVNFDGLLIEEVTPITAFEENADTLCIYPDFNADECLTLRRIFISENDFWGTVTQPYIETINYKKTDSYSYVTLDTGVTLGFILLNDEEAYVIESQELSSSYVEKVCEQVCKQNT